MILASDFLLPHLGKLVLIWYQNGNTVINYFTWLYRQNVECSHVESSQSSLICRHIPERYGRECEQTRGDSEGRGSLVCRSHGVAKSRTRLSDPTTARGRHDFGLPRWLSDKESTCQAGDAGLIPGSRRSPGGGNGNILQCSCRENPVDRGAWWATVQGVAKSRTRLRDQTTTTTPRFYFGFSLFLWIWT